MSDDGRGEPFRSHISPSDVWRMVAADERARGSVTEDEVQDIDGVHLFGLIDTRKRVKKWIKSLSKDDAGGGGGATEGRKEKSPALSDEQGVTVVAGGGRAKSPMSPPNHELVSKSQMSPERSAGIIRIPRKATK